jgi:hypothetical protein
MRKAIGMLADMESDPDIRRVLLDVERAEAVAYLEYPPTPRWYFPAVGAWSALLVLAVTGLGDRPALAVPLLVALLAIEWAFLAWYRRYRQTMPSLTGAPVEIRREFTRYFVGLVVVVGLCVGAGLLGGPIAAAVVAFVTVTTGLVLYERRYAAAARATRQRLR